MNEVPQRSTQHDILDAPQAPAFPDRHRDPYGGFEQNDHVVQFVEQYGDSGEEKC